MSVSISDLHWTAGFLEGEGAFTICGSDSRIIASQVEPDPIDKLVRLFGGKVYKRIPPANNHGKKPYHVWILGGNHGAALMMTLYVMMSAKRQRQIARALLSWRSRGARTGDHHYASTITDADALVAMRRVFSGEALTSVARSIGIHHTVLHTWMIGRSRPYLLNQLGMEPHARPRQHGASHYRSTVLDDDALDAMRRVRNGAMIYRVAELIGVSSTTLGFWLSGKKRPYLLARLEQEAHVSKEEVSNAIGCTK